MTLAKRLDRALSAGRSWTVDDARKLFWDHPIVRRAARALIWWSDEGSFRVTEDGTFANASDDVVKSISGRVRLAHPAALRDEKTLNQWGDVFSDYELLQPIEQLGRGVDNYDGALKTLLAPLKKQRVPSRKVLGGFESRGWQRRGWGGFERTFEHGTGGHVYFSAPFNVAEIQTDETTLGEVQCEPTWDQLDDAIRAEVMRDLVRLFGA